MGLILGVVSRNVAQPATVARHMMRDLQYSNFEKSWVIDRRSTESGNDKLESVCDQAMAKICFSTEVPLESPGFDCSRNLTLLFEGNLYNIRELRANLITRHSSHLRSASEVVAHLLEDSYHGDLKIAVKKMVTALDGAYLLVASDGRETVVLRDPAGLRPAFYAESNELIAFASLKKALWNIGLHDVKPLRAGVMFSFSKNSGITSEDVCSIRKIGDKNRINDMAKAVDRYCDLVDGAVRKRIRDVGKVGVLMSGGVDSCLMAKLVKDIADERGIEVIAYTAGLDSTDDIESAQKYAQEIGITHKLRRLTLDEVESYIHKVAYTVEERDMVQIEAGVGIYAALEQASQDGIHEIFSGQGPDELWGGYTWYPDVVASEGYEGLQERMFDDLWRGDIETFDRENKIAMAFGSEQLFPYCDAGIVKMAMNVSPHLKVKSAEDTIGKHPHREAALRFGVPRAFAYRGKNAAQHGTGVHDTLDSVSRRNGFTPDLIEQIGYNSKEVSKETLASSTRYGYRYGDRKLWEAPDHVQFFIDSVAYQKGLLNQDEREVISRYLVQAGL